MASFFLSPAANPLHFVPVRIRSLILLLLFALALTGRCESPNDLPRGIEVKDYTGWGESVYLQAGKRPVLAVMAPAVGGRIVHYGLDGENILFENAAAQGRTWRASKGPLWIGGYQCDIGPESLVLPSHEELFVASHHWRTDGDFAVTAYSSSNALFRLQIEKEFVLARDTGDLGIIQRLRNNGDKEIQCYLWDRTLCKGGGFAFFPLNKKSRFKAGWSIQKKVDGKAEYDGESPFSIHAQVIDGLLVAEAIGQPTRVAADSDAGWIAYVHGDLLFIKYFPWIPEGGYSEGGNTVALYFDQRVAELEPMSPQITLEPGKNYTFPEQWTLLRLEKPVATPEEARNLLKKIPPSPFKGKR